MHLIGISLHEEERCKPSDDSMEVDQPDTFTAKAAKYNIYQLLKQLVGSQRIESHKHLLEWVLKKWEKVAGISGSKFAD